MEKLRPGYIDVQSSEAACDSATAPTVCDPIPSRYQPKSVASHGVTEDQLLGETIAMLHDRAASAMEEIVDECDHDGISSILICSHAAPIIALGRVLTGKCPVAKPKTGSPPPIDSEEEWQTPDFSTYTCCLSTFRRNRLPLETSSRSEPSYATASGAGPHEVVDTGKRLAEENRAEHPKLTNSAAKAPLWWAGRGVAGGWTCERNGETSFLSNGAQRGW